MVGILLWAFRSLVVKPFRTLLDGSRLVAGGQFDHRIDLGTGDELSELADAMNDMTDRFQGALRQVNSYCTDLDRQVRERTREVIQNEHLASVGFLAAGVAHEINNPLATVAWSAESLQSRVAEIAMLASPDRLVDDELCDALTTNLRRIEDEAYRCKGITEKLLDFSRLSEIRRAPTDLVELVTDVVTMVGKVGKYRCKTIRTHFEGPVVAHVNPQEIRQVVLNLVTNSLESVDCDGAVDVHVRTHRACASVAVEDNGCGMTAEVLRHLFEPFFTRRRDGTGTGLGLSITYRIVSQHGGSLTASSDGEGCGSRLEMLLPLTAESKDSTASHHTLGLNHEPYETVE
jgi:signal transduction histidine kinase